MWANQPSSARGALTIASTKINLAPRGLSNLTGAGRSRMRNSSAFAGIASVSPSLAMRAGTSAYGMAA